MKVFGKSINYPESVQQVTKYLFIFFFAGFIPSIILVIIDTSKIVPLVNFLETVSGQYSKWWISTITEPLAGFLGISLPIKQINN